MKQYTIYDENPTRVETDHDSVIVTFHDEEHCEFEGDEGKIAKPLEEIPYPDDLEQITHFFQD